MKLSELFEEYRREYLKDRASEDEGAKRKKGETGTQILEKASGSSGGGKVPGDGSEQGNRRPS